MISYGSDKEKNPSKGKRNAPRTPKAAKVPDMNEQLLMKLSSITSQVSMQEKAMLALAEIPSMVSNLSEKLDSVSQRVDQLDQVRQDEILIDDTTDDPMLGIMNDFGLNEGQLLK